MSNRSHVDFIKYSQWQLIRSALIHICLFDFKFFNTPSQVLHLIHWQLSEIVFALICVNEPLQLQLCSISYVFVNNWVSNKTIALFLILYFIFRDYLNMSAHQRNKTEWKTHTHRANTFIPCIFVPPSAHVSFLYVLKTLSYILETNWHALVPSHNSHHNKKPEGYYWLCSVIFHLVMWLCSALSAINK